MKIFFGISIFFILGSYHANACDPTQADVLPPFLVEVTMFDAIFTGGDYREAAYDALADELDESHGNADPGSYFFPLRTRFHSWVGAQRIL